MKILNSQNCDNPSLLTVPCVPCMILGTFSSVQFNSVAQSGSNFLQPHAL